MTTNILKELCYCRNNQVDFFLIFKNNKNRVQYSWKWDIIDNYTLSIYDEEWDAVDNILISDIYSCVPIDKEDYMQLSNEEFNILVDSVYKNFCSRLDKKDYEGSKKEIKLLNDIISTMS